MTVVLTESSDDTTTVDQITAGAPADDGAALAPWRARAGAFAVDVLLGVGTLAALAVVWLSTTRLAWPWWVCLIVAGAVFLAMAVNRLLLPVVTGWSLGRALFGIAVVDRDGVRVGPWRLLARDAGHLLDTVALFIGWVWPLVDSRNRTFADLLARTEVHRAGGKPLEARRIAAMVAALCAAVAVAAAAVGYLAVYRPALRVQQAKEQLAVQGPDLVVDMLSYDVKTLQADFDRAKSVVTDNYRPQLEQQQQAVLKSGPVDNTYWSSNSSVLTAGENNGTMLVFLQGQRGTPPNFRTITATVKADFARVVDGSWKVSNLTVLVRPRPGGGG